MFAKLLFDHIERQVEPSVRFHPRQCLRSRLSTHGCAVCISHCEKQAITLREKRIVFNEDVCSGCLACVAACPNDAFECDFDISPVLHALRFDTNKEPVVLACQKQNPLANQIDIPCIGYFSEPLLAALHCAASRYFFLEVGKCANCENSRMLAVLEDRIQALRSKTGQSDEWKLRYRADNKCDSEDVRLQRRSLLRAAKKTFIGLGREVAAESVSAKEVEPIGIGEKGPALTSRVLNMTLDLLHKENHQERKLLLFYYYTITVSEDCTLCPSCTGMCPTGALKRIGNGSQKQLCFTSSHCNGCGLCVAFCRKKALELHAGTVENPHGVVAASLEGKNVCSDLEHLN